MSLFLSTLKIHTTTLNFEQTKLRCSFYYCLILHNFIFSLYLKNSSPALNTSIFLKVLIMEKAVISDIIDVSKSIDGHSFTFEWLLESLRSNDTVYQRKHGCRSVKAVTIKDISGGKGFASNVLRCVLTFVDSVNDSDSYSTILKIPFFNTFNKNQSKVFKS